MVAGTEDVLGSSLESRPSATMTANITPEAIKEAWTQLQALENTSLLTAGARDTEKELNIIRDFLSKVPIPLLFACLDSVAPVRGEQTRQAAVKEKAFKLATKSLDRVFQSPEGPSILANHEIHAYLLFGMNHPAHAIREFTLRQMARAMTASEQRSGECATDFADKVITSPVDLLSAAVQRILDESIPVSDAACTLVLSLSKAARNEDRIKLCSLVFKGLHQVREVPVGEHEHEDPSHRELRLLDVLIRIAVSSGEAMEVCREQVSTSIMEILASEDILLQVNVIELLPLFASSAEGLHFILSQNIMQRLLALAGQGDESEADPLLGSVALRLVGELSAAAAKHGSSVFVSSSRETTLKFLRAALRYATSGEDPSLSMSRVLAAMDALSAFATSSPAALRLIVEDTAVVKAWLSHAWTGGPNMKACCLFSVARVLASGTSLATIVGTSIITADTPAYSGALDEETQLLKERFFQALARSEHTSAMDVLMTELRQPFPELRHASFDVLRALAAQPHSWGVKTLFAYGGFADFLLDQKTEATKEAKEWKFSVIDALVGSPTASQLLSTRDPGLWDKIGNVFRGGPYSVGKPQPKVDLEAA